MTVDQQHQMVEGEGLPEGFSGGWAILQLMGNRQIAGFITPMRVTGELMLRMTVPIVGVIPTFHRFYSLRSIYSITPLDEKNARIAADRLKVPLLPIERERNEQSSPDRREPPATGILPRQLQQR